MINNESLARRVYETAPEFLIARFTCAELKAADQWIAAYAINQLRKVLTETKPVMSDAFIDWAVSCASLHFGSAGTDAMLIALDCYPTWMYKKEPGVVS